MCNSSTGLGHLSLSTRRSSLYPPPMPYLEEKKTNRAAREKKHPMQRLKVRKGHNVLGK